jgi:hypothetical protein
VCEGLRRVAGEQPSASNALGFGFGLRLVFRFGFVVRWVSLSSLTFSSDLAAFCSCGCR